jgi:hypothetical protein
LELEVSITVTNSKGFGAFIDNASESTFDEVTISQQGSIITVYNATGRYMGMMNSSTWKTITRIPATHSIRIEAYINIKDPDIKKDSKKAPLLIVLYGSAEDSDAVGDYLSDSELFLQHPPIYDTHVQYRNPQYYYIPGMEIDMPSIDSGNTPAVSKRQQSYDIKDDLMRLFNATTEIEGAEQCSVSDRVSTPLLEYALSSIPGDFTHNLTYVHSTDTRGTDFAS